MGHLRLTDPDGPTVSPAAVAGMLVAAVLVPTLLVEALRGVVAPEGLNVLYVPGVLVLAVFARLRWALLALGLGALAFNIVHLDPRSELALKGEDGAALLVMVGVTAVVSALARAGRQAREQSERRRLEADLLTELARLFLGDTSGPRADPDRVMVRGLTQILEVPVALADEQPTGEDQMGLPLRGPEDELPIAVLVVPASIPPPAARRLRRIAPALGALLAEARRRARTESERMAHESLRRETALKTAILRSVSHDLRAPLAGLAAASSALGAERVGEEDRVELADVVGEETTRLNWMMEGLMDAARLDAGAVEPVTEPVDVAEVVAAAADEVQGLDLVTEVDGLPPADADPQLLQRALVNLFVNARTHGQNRDVRVRGEAVPGAVRLVVSDAGPGIPAAVRERVTEPFVRAGGGGSGLGLAIARGFTEANGGRMSVDEGAGTRVTIELPASE